jgi:hypothetical protein
MAFRQNAVKRFSAFFIDRVMERPASPFPKAKSSNDKNKKARL